MTEHVNRDLDPDVRKRRIQEPERPRDGEVPYEDEVRVLGSGDLADPEKTADDLIDRRLDEELRSGAGDQDPRVAGSDSIGPGGHGTPGSS
jgi:hypothetical protein